MFFFFKGFEQCNSFLTTHLFSATNRHTGDIHEINADNDDEEHYFNTDNYIVQLLLRILRIEDYREEEEEDISDELDKE